MPSGNKTQSFSYKKQTIDFGESFDKNANILNQTIINKRDSLNGEPLFLVCRAW